MIDLKILAYEETPLGPLCLRRRKTLSEPRQWVTEVTLNHEFLMSSLHTDSERALATIPLKQTTGSGLRVLVGGLGLGYTAHSALTFEHVDHVEVIEYLPQVIDWLRDDMTPLAEELNASNRLNVSEGDIYEFLLASPTTQRFDVILIDVDHSPEDRLAKKHDSFYQVDGLRKAAAHLTEHGAFALWSYDEHTPLWDAMRHVFSSSTAHPITYFNQHVQESFTDWLYVGTTALKND
ncbi:MAG: spermidine synthase [Phycisphaera sp. RhM]|nr:spermidine synthase [Phycisphaera sp. RhM]